MAENPILATMERDTEALLVNRLRNRLSLSQECEHYIAPIDECFKLVGLIRSRWRGLSGGTDVWQEIARFFSALRDRSEIPPRVAMRPNCES